MSEFKVGDKVRCTECDSQGTIVGFLGKHNEYVRVKHLDENIYVVWRIEHCELLHTNPKREFLERLQSLMREFDAEITQDNGCFDIHINGKYVHTIEGGDEYSLTADKIKDSDEKLD